VASVTTSLRQNTHADQFVLASSPTVSWCAPILFRRRGNAPLGLRLRTIMSCSAQPTHPCTLQARRSFIPCCTPAILPSDVLNLGLSDTVSINSSGPSPYSPLRPSSFAYLRLCICSVLISFVTSSTFRGASIYQPLHQRRDGKTSIFLTHIILSRYIEFVDFYGYLRDYYIVTHHIPDRVSGSTLSKMLYPLQLEASMPTS